MKTATERQYTDESKTALKRDKRAYFIKAILNKQFAGHTFKVHIEKYSMGESIHINTDLIKDIYKECPQGQNLNWKRDVGNTLTEEEYKIYEEYKQLLEQNENNRNNIKSHVGQFERIDRDETGDILSGCNTIMFVEAV